MSMVQTQTDAGCATIARESGPWYAIRTRSNYEKIVADGLSARGLEQYLPLYRSSRGKTDRGVETKIPLFSGYVFGRFDANYRTPVLSVPGVVSVVGFAGKPCPISDDEIAAIQTALSSGRLAEPWPYLREGQRIRVECGPLKGVEGILIKKQDFRLVISVHMLQRSVAVEIDPGSVAAI